MRRTGVLFSRPMVLALRKGTKTQTRRVIVPQPREGVTWASFFHGVPMCRWMTGDPQDLDTWEFGIDFICPYGVPGDQLYCKETCIPAERNDGRILYAADYEEPQLTAIGVARGGWKPSILMRADEARLIYTITDIRVERLQEITEEDAKAEGIEPAVDGSYRSAYAALWNQINAGYKPVKVIANKRWAVAHHVCHPWGGPDSKQTYKGLPLFIRPNPFVFALTLEPLPANPSPLAPQAPLPGLRRTRRVRGPLPLSHRYTRPARAKG